LQFAGTDRHLLLLSLATTTMKKRLLLMMMMMMMIATKTTIHNTNSNVVVGAGTYCHEKLRGEDSFVSSDVGRH
jgi:PhoPQ-activated pathogenicity-related protein